MTFRRGPRQSLDHPSTIPRPSLALSQRSLLLFLDFLMVSGGFFLFFFCFFGVMSSNVCFLSFFVVSCRVLFFFCRFYFFFVFFLLYGVDFCSTRCFSQQIRLIFVNRCCFFFAICPCLDYFWVNLAFFRVSCFFVVSALVIAVDFTSSILVMGSNFPRRSLTFFR